MRTEQVLEIVRELGFDVVLKEGRPMLTRPPGKTEGTDELLAVLKIHKERIVALLSKEEQGGH